MYCHVEKSRFKRMILTLDTKKKAARMEWKYILGGYPERCPV